MASIPNKTDPADRDPAAGPASLNNQAEKAAYSTAGYTSHSHSPSDGQGGSQASPVPAVHPLHPAPHGYNHAPPGPSDAHIHPELRSASDPTAPPNSAYPPVPASNIMGAQHQPNNHHIVPGPLAPIGGSPEPMDMGGDGMQDGRGNKKRELSTSKRAAQNRAAQRAFRQRKEGYIKSLEQQVRDYQIMEANFKSTQAEVNDLRQYIFVLQSRLVDAIGEYPTPPPSLNIQPLPQPNAATASGPEPPQVASATNPIEVAAQAVAGLNSSMASREHYRAYEQAAGAEEDARTAENIRQLAGDVVPDGLPAPLG